MDLLSIVTRNGIFSDYSRNTEIYFKYLDNCIFRIKVDAYKGKTFKGHVDSIQRASGAKSSLFPPENAVGSFVKIVQRIPVKIVFDEEIKKEEFNIVSGMSVVPKVKVK